MSDIDILAKLSAIDVSTVKTALPILQSGVVAATITKITPSTDEKGNDMITIQYALASGHVDVDGSPVQPGFPLTERIYLNDWTDPQSGEVKNFGIVRLAQLREALFGAAPAGTRLNLAEFINQTPTLRLRYDPMPKNKKTGETFSPRTEIVGYVKAKPVAGPSA